MRIAILHPARKEPDGTDVEPSVSAFRLGRIEDHVNHLTGETTPAAKVAEILAKQAAEEYPDCEIQLQRLVDNGDETSTWIPAHEVPEGAVSPKGGVIASHELTAEQASTAIPETPEQPATPGQEVQAV